MSLDAQGLLAALRERGLVGAAVAPPAAVAASGGTSDRPWYIAALLGVSGWFAGLFLLVFVGMFLGLRPSSTGPAAVAGALLVAGAWGLFKMSDEAHPSRVFVAQLALALSLAGQGLVLFAVSADSGGLTRLAGAALALQLVLVLLMPDRLHRTLSALFATVAWALLVRSVLFDDLRNFSGAYHSGSLLAKALGAWLLSWVPPGAGLWALVVREPAWMARGLQPIARPALAGLVAGLAFATLASQPVDSLLFWGRHRSEHDWLALWPLLSALGALGGVAAAFAVRSRALVGACAVAALLHVSLFYYELGVDLLFKSLLMLAMGGALLLAARELAKGARP